VDETRPTQLVRVVERSVGTQKKEAIAALISEATVSAAAAKAGVSEIMLLTWLNDPTFKADYRVARQAAADEDVTDAVVRLQQGVGAAVDALTRNLTCGLPAVEVEAAKAILDHAVEGLERSQAKTAPRENRSGRGQ
jgi:hypothetical protein